MTSQMKKQTQRRWLSNSPKATQWVSEKGVPRVFLLGAVEPQTAGNPLPHRAGSGQGTLLEPVMHKAI